MKKHNRIIAGVLAVCLMGCMPVVSLMASAEIIDSGTCGQNVTWAFDNDSWTFNISGTGDMTEFFNNNYCYVPWSYLLPAINNVIIEDGVTSISTATFYNASNLKSVSIPDSVISIGNRAFSTCDNLTKITILNPECKIDNSISNGYDFKSER
ncbi:MAG: leucine-rich repeat domain-containing protein, partial [Ruminococcus sp.]|nr:leucine-rich repeat domain-containing protein [Ruminococcus sp.]